MTKTQTVVIVVSCLDHNPEDKIDVTTVVCEGHPKAEKAPLDNYTDADEEWRKKM